MRRRDFLRLSAVLPAAVALPVVAAEVAKPAPVPAQDVTHFDDPDRFIREIRAYDINRDAIIGRFDIVNADDHYFSEYVLGQGSSRIEAAKCILTEARHHREWIKPKVAGGIDLCRFLNLSELKAICA